MGYALTLLGAQKLMYRYSLSFLGNPLDIEIMIACKERTLRCLEVNPALIGVYREPGSASSKASDIDMGQGQNTGENPMGPRSVKALMRSLYRRYQPANTG